jgi:preprotein translocase subunit YajC
MSRRDKKALAASKEVLDLLQKAERIVLTEIGGIHSADLTIGQYTLGEAIERFKSFHATVHVAVHDTLPPEHE